MGVLDTYDHKVCVSCDSQVKEERDIKETEDNPFIRTLTTEHTRLSMLMSLPKNRA